ncbi:serine palmitoyltransferase component [Polyrhizophydium stewartii]|uniref:serine C-palmitoyltransferase n=1 Tax=Polyrhizophydium stewartii TaxID=2732419 RepID=A0ABR4NB45_9FUNG
MSAAPPPESLGNVGLVSEAARETAYQLVMAVNTTYAVAAQLYTSIPGARIVYKYVKASYQNDPYRTLLEVGLVVFMVWYWFNRRYKPGSNDVKLTDKLTATASDNNIARRTQQEIQELIDEWEPEPLVPPLTAFQREELDKLPVLTSAPGLKVKTADGKERLNFSTFNFLGVMNSEEIKDKAIESLRKYGVGTCGPPGFYGTLDVHMELEHRLAAFVQAEAAILYAQGFSCVTSCIPAFAKRGDIVIVDDGANFAVQKGAQISRSHVRYFRHNDMADLERVLKKVHADFAKKPLTRRFIIVEGLYANLGDVCPLPKLLELKKRYKYRLIVEESMSFGVLGPRGAGVADFFGVPPKEIDIMVASLGNALAAAGGFCAGSKEIVEHQRLSSQAYTFSASLPAIMAVGALEALRVLEAKPEVLKTLSDNTALVRAPLEKLDAGYAVTVSGVAESPLVHVQLHLPSRDDAERVLQDVVDQALKDGVLVTRAKYVARQEHNLPPASIRIVVSAGFTRRDAQRCGTVVADALRRVLKQHRIIK